MRNLAHTLLLLLLPLLCLTSTSHAQTLIWGVAPSFPKPVAEFEELEEEVIRPDSKFEAKRKKAEKRAKFKESSANDFLPTKTQAWNQVLEHIANDSGLSIRYEPASSQLDFELKLAKGYYDLAYITPLQFHAFRDFPGYQAQLKRKAQPIRGMVFVKKLGTISTLSELRSSIVAFPGLLDFAGSVVTRESLHKLQFEVVPQYLASEKAVYESVATGQFIAGSGTDESFRAQAPEIRNALKIVWDSPGFSPYPVVAHPRVDFFTLTRLKRAMVQMNKNVEAKKLLRYIFVENGFEPAKNSDWDEIKQIDLKRLNGSPNSVEVTEPEAGD